MKLTPISRLVLMGLFIAGLQACGSSGTDSPTGVRSDTANFIDTNHNGVKDANEVFDANHNNIDDAAECLAGDDNHNGVIDGKELHGVNDVDHNGIDDETEEHGVKGACIKEANDDVNRGANHEVKELKDVKDVNDDKSGIKKTS